MPEALNLNSDAAQLPGSFSKRHAVTREAAFAASTVLRLLVSVGFQVLFISLMGMLFIDHSRYFCAIGRQRVLSLGGWAPRFHTEFHDIRATLGHLSTESTDRRVRDCHPVSSAFPDRSAGRAFVTPRGPATPGRSLVWARSVFARRY